MSITNSKVAKFLKKTEGSKSLKYAVIASLVMIGFTAIYKVVMKLWFIIALFLRNKKLSFVILIIAVLFGLLYMGVQLDLLDKFLFS